MNVRFRLLAAFALIASLFAVTLTAAAQDNDYQPIGRTEFQQVWERTDLPVAELQVDRTWIWGPGAISGVIEEPYLQAEGGTREVQYFDKSRMEMPDGNSDPDSPWFITQGLLATELMTGRLQVGDEQFVPHHPAEIPVAGDRDDPHGPTYALMGQFMDWEPRPTGSVIYQRLHRDGTVTDEQQLGNYGVTDEVYIQETNHNIASVFWAFMTSTSIVFEDGQYVEAGLFQDAFYAVGFPTTEAYWVLSTVDGVEQDVLLQCFERRCLTFTPGNPEGWQVESGNVGRHYFEWRYEMIVAPGVVAGASVAPATADNTVGEDHTVTATIVDPNNDPVEGSDVVLTITDGPNAGATLGPVTTNAAGEAQFTLTSNTQGEDTFTVSVAGSPHVTATGTATWSLRVVSAGEQLTLAPATDTNPVGTEHTVTATLLDNQNNPIAGAVVEFTVTGDNTATGFGTTDANGQATFTYTGTTVGTDNIDATAAGVDANGAAAGPTAATATKTWQ